MSSDAKDILGSLVVPSSLQKEPKRTKKRKRPDGMSNEVFGLLNFSENDPVTLVPTHAANGGYKERPKLWRKQCREWELKECPVPGRKDSFKIKTWVPKNSDDSKLPDFNLNKITIPRNNKIAQCDGTWTKDETEYMLDLCEMFDCRFIIVADRYEWKIDGNRVERSVEDIKERYYKVTDHTITLGDDIKRTYVYDADHERRRKEQLSLFYRRCRKDADDQDRLVEERKRIEQKRKLKEKKEADKKAKKTQAIAKIPKSSSGRASPQVFDEDEIGLKAPDFGIKFPELKPGVSLRSKIMILPASGRKRRTEIIETAIKEFGISTHPIPTEEVTTRFNKLRSDILKLHDVRQAFQHTECELVALIKKFNETCPGSSLPKGVESIETLKRSLSSPTNAPSKKHKS